MIKVPANCILLNKFTLRKLLRLPFIVFKGKLCTMWRELCTMQVSRNKLCTHVSEGEQVR